MNNIRDKKRILIVDDEPDMVDTLLDILEDIGYEVEVALNGQGAIEKIKKSFFDIVIMDIVMPDITGIEAHRKMAKIVPEIRVILMTAYTAPQVIEKAIEEGVCECISKPFPPNKIIQLIEHILSKKE